MGTTRSFSFFYFYLNEKMMKEKKRFFLIDFIKYTTQSSHANCCFSKNIIPILCTVLV